MDELVPSEFYLSQNYPNPFKEKTTIKYCVPDKTSIKLTVLDPDMTIIKELENDLKEAGTYEVEFSTEGGSLPVTQAGASGGDVNNLPSGIYYYRFEAKEFNKIRKMILIK
jgi:hypothetical protein